MRTIGMAMTVLAMLAGVVLPSTAQPQIPDGAVPSVLPDDVVDLAPADRLRADRMRSVSALEPATHALLTTADAFPDALASGVLQDDAMLLGTSGGLLDAASAALLQDSDVTQVTVLGGTAAVADSVLAGLGADVRVRRISGDERTATAARIAAAKGGSPEVVLLARARGPEGNPSAGFVDALGAGAWAADSGYPILLIDSDVVGAHTAQAISDLDPERIIAIGGTAAISDATLTAAAAGRPTGRVAGPERSSTAAAVAHAMRPDGADSVFLLDGTDPDVWASGFASARPAALRDGVILLSDGDAIPRSTADALADLAPSSIHCLSTAAACLAARQEAGMPEPGGLAVTPRVGQPLFTGTRVSVESDEGDVSLLDDGGCLEDWVRVGDPTLDCTITVRTQPPAPAVPTTATLTWPAITVDAMTTTAAPEYTSPTTGGRWDYDEAVDVRPDADLQASRGAYVDPSRSALVYGPNHGAVPILWASYGGAVPVAPDGLAVPVDTSRFDRVVVRLRLSERSSIGVEWRRCHPDTEINCIMPDSILGRGYAAEWVDPGWQTLTLDMAASPGWSDGPVHTIYLAAPTGTIVDDVRISDGSPTTPITVTTAPGTTVVWDRDADPSNNTDPASTAWGILEGGLLDPDVLPPGEYHLHVTHGSPTTAGSTIGPITIHPGSPIDAPPPPTVEWARDVRGNPWDFAPGGLVAGTDDIIEMGNATRVEGPGLTAVNSNATGDPYFMLDVPMPIDSRAFRTITVNFTVDGPFDLGYDPGGGTHGRILFQHEVDGPWRNGNDLVAYPTQTSYTVDMTGLNALEPGTPAWDSAPVVGIRFDPNEDPGAGRRWTVTSIELTP